MAPPIRSKIHKCTCIDCRTDVMSKTAESHRAINQVLSELDEKRRRHFVGLLAAQWGHGGIARLIEITGMSRNTIVRGRAELSLVDADTSHRVRKAGGGRKQVEKNNQRS